MKPMKGKSFVDTNIVVYCYSETEEDKKIIAQNISLNPDTVISTQVIQEFGNTMLKKFGQRCDSVQAAIQELSLNYQIYINTPETIMHACLITDKYRYSFYDSLIIASALEAGCHSLYTEDMQHNQMIDNKLRILNPFV